MNIDDQVRQTLHAVADAQRVPEGLARRLQDSPAGPVVGVAPRHRWKRIVPPLLAAAAVIIAAVTTTVVVSTQADQHPPAVPITSIPAPTPTPDLPTPTATNPAPSTSTAPAQAAPSSPASVSTHQLALPFYGAAALSVSLTVPQDWVVSNTQPKACCSIPPTTCLVAAGKDYTGNPNNCFLAVTVPRSTVGISPDFPLPWLDQPKCAGWKTTAESEPTIAGRPVEYRKFLNPCTGQASEQWTTMNTPQVAFWHPITATSTSAAVSAIISSAVLPPVTNSQRAYDVGYIRGFSKQADGYHVQLDRVVANLDGTVTNLNPGTYDYLLRSGNVVFNGSIPAECGGDPVSNNCATEAEILKQFSKGPSPVDGSYVVDGAFVTLDNGLDNALSLTFTSPTPFTS